MFQFVNKLVAGLVGNKKEKDLKGMDARVERINAYYNDYASISNNELRGKTVEFRQRIAEHLSSITAEIDELNAQIADPSIDHLTKDPIFKAKEELIKKRNKSLEVVLDEILEEAFAVVKQTAYRFANQPTIVSDATERDMMLAESADYVTIEGDQAVYKNTWDAAGAPITWNMVHYDVQLIGGMILHSGKIAEMATGEGKTLVSTLPSYLNALAGYGVHLVTVNDYLARRDCEWNGPLFEFLGITVDCIEYYEPNSPERRNAYLADLTYGTNNEFGFDYLRDNMARSIDDIVQRGHHFAMVDEVDSVLVDDARTPLIISGPTPKGDEHEFYEIKPRIEKLIEAQKRVVSNSFLVAKDAFAKGLDTLSKEEEKQAGIALLRAYRGLPRYKPLIKLLSEPGVRVFLQKTENVYMAESAKQMPVIDAELYFVIDEKNNSNELTEKGIETITGSAEDADFFVLPDLASTLAEIDAKTSDNDEKLRLKDAAIQEFSIKSERIHTVSQLLKAYTLFEKDVEYIIDEGKVKIVDEQTGRVLDGRRYSDGLHQAIEAKENVTVEASTQTYATITLQNYFRLFHKLCGMTGTAETEAEELWKIYKLDVVTIPTNKPIVRDDRQDKVYKTAREKYNAVIEEIKNLTDVGRPVLVGTTSVEISELLSRMLKQRGVKHNVLNAKQHQREAEVVAEAGLSGAVTIATNMAGRGTDIKLGPNVKDAGGLAIIGTERHESRRVDRQLRGRAGRQGDPGSSQFYVSLEDNLMRLFGSERIASIMDRLKMEEGEVLQHSMITKSIERAQKKVEQNNFGIRKRLLEYDDVMNAQREVIYARRRNALYGDKLQLDIAQMTADMVDMLVVSHHEAGDFENLEIETFRTFASDTPFKAKEFAAGNPEVLSEQLLEHVNSKYQRQQTAIINKALPALLRIRQQVGDRAQNIIVPFTDGIKSINITVGIDRVLGSEGRELCVAFERSLTLAIIDDKWKEHLREMDDLRQSVQNAVYEQKDPLLIYKEESFMLFRQMLEEIAKEILSFLFKGDIYSEDETEVAAEVAAPREIAPKTATSRSDYFAEPTSTAQAAPRQGQRTASRPAPPQFDANSETAVKPQPVKAADKVGRNDACPCGSGKKFKNCHGKA